MGDSLLHHVQPHAPAGNLGHRGGRAETGFEDEVIGFLGAQGLSRGHQTPVDGFGQDGLPVESSAVVLDFDDDVAPLVEGPQPR